MWSSDSESDFEEEVVIMRRRRLFRPRVNYTFQTVFEFNERFRLSGIKLQELCERIGHVLQHDTARNHALTVPQQIQAALHWLGTGAQYHAVGDMHGISKATICRSVHRTIRAINDILLHQVVCWPNQNEIRNIVQRFNLIAGMPMVIGCIDGTLINIDAPSENEEAFVDRHGNHSLNAMAVCGPDLRFLYINVNWPGSVHDARVLRTSSLHDRFEAGWRLIPNGVILGDSAYPLKEWLIPPLIRNPNDVAEQRFLRSHRQTRRVIEQAFGILKEKFPCLNHLRLSPQIASHVVMACVVLCNFSKNNDGNGLLIDNIDLNEDDNVNAIEDARVYDNFAGENRLQEIVNHFR